MRKSIDSLLNQTFTKFELIISDNASTDNTEQICKEYVKIDKRIQYYRQKRNIGGIRNFSYVLNKANSKYFMWAADDDLWEDTFLEKNINVLESNPQIVGSISEVDFYGIEKDVQRRYKGKGDFKKFKKYRFVHPITGTFKEKFSFYLNFMEASMQYGVFRTKEIHNCVGFYHQPWDLMIILRVLEFGNLHVIDEILLHRLVGGLSSKDTYKNNRREGFSHKEIIFIFYPFFQFCIKQFGMKFFLKNFRAMVKLCYIVYGRFILDNIRKML